MILVYMLAEEKRLEQQWLMVKVVGDVKLINSLGADECELESISVEVVVRITVNAAEDMQDGITDRLAKSFGARVDAIEGLTDIGLTDNAVDGKFVEIYNVVNIVGNLVVVDFVGTAVGITDGNFDEVDGRLVGFCVSNLLVGI